MSGVSCYSSFFMFRDSCVLAFGWINVVWRKISLSWRRTHHGRPNPFSRHGRPSSLLHRRSRNGRRPGGLLSCLHVPWGLQSAHPPSPLDVVQRGMCLLGGGVWGFNVRTVSPCPVFPLLLCPYLVSFLFSFSSPHYFTSSRCVSFISLLLWALCSLCLISVGVLCSNIWMNKCCLKKDSLVSLFPVSREMWQNSWP